MKRLLLIFLSIGFCFSAFAVKLDERYVMKPFEGGQIYFILPYSIPSEATSTKDLLADITYLTNSDSVTINLSVWSKNELQADSIVFIGNQRMSLCKFQTFFIEKDEKQWHHRYSMHIPLESLNSLYKNPVPFALCIYAQEGILRYANSVRMWKTEQEWMNQILHIILRNKKIYEQNNK